MVQTGNNSDLHIAVRLLSTLLVLLHKGEEEEVLQGLPIGFPPAAHLETVEG